MVNVQVANWLQRVRGVNVPRDWLNACIEWLQEEHQGSLAQAQLCTQVYDQWLFADLRELAQPCLPTDLPNIEKIQLDQVYCLQVDSVVDVGTSYYSQLLKVTGKQNSNSEVSAAHPTQPFWEPKPKRMLMLQLTDGVTEVKGMEYRPIPALSTNLPAGVKVKVKGKVLCRKGVLMLKTENLEIMGGEVEALTETNTPQHCLQVKLEANVNNTVNPGPKEFRQNVKSNPNNQRQSTGSVRQQNNSTRPNNIAKPQMKMQNEALDELGNEWDDDDFDLDDIMQQLESPTLDNKSLRTAPQSRSTNQPPPGGQSSRLHSAAPSGVNATVADVGNNGNQSFPIGNRLKSQNRQFNDSKPANISDRGSGVILTSVKDETNTSAGTVGKVRSINANNNSNFASASTAIQNQGTRNLSTKSQNLLRPSSSMSCDATSSTGASNNVWKPSKDLDPSLGVNDFKVKTESIDVLQGDQYNYKRKSEDIKDEKQVKVLKSESKILKHEAARPWVYLSEVLQNPPPTCKVKAYIATVVGKLDVNKGNFWSLPVKINDGSAAVDVDLSDQFLESLIGFSAQEYRAMKARLPAEPHLKSVIMNSVNNCQKQIVELNAILELQFSPQSPRPIVVSAEPLSDVHFQALTTVVSSDA